MPTKQATDIKELAINTIRFLAVDAVEKANSGHPGMPMGMASPAYTLWTQFLKHNPRNPNWANRDRFVLSAGHGSMLLYALLHLTGYDVSLDDLKNFRQWHSKTPGHPEYQDTPGVETTTGPLGQGISTAVGMAMGQRYLNSILGAKDGALLDYRIFGICSDGDLMEGVSAEAASMAGHLKLGSLVFLYDDNGITIDGKTDLAFSENVSARFEAYGWHVQAVADANNIQAVAQAIQNGINEKGKPSLIAVKSNIGFGSPNKQDSAGAHGSPLGADEVALTKQKLNWPEDPTFFIPNDVKPHFLEAVDSGAQLEKQWKQHFERWAKANPAGAQLWARLEAKKLPDGWEKHIPDFKTEPNLATRAASGKVINALAGILPELVGGSADLAPSNNTMVKGAPTFSAKEAGRNFHFGIREHAMSAALNGMALTEKLIPYGGTFLIFTDYMKGAMRLSAVMKQKVIYVLTHDSIGLGEDGPTHQPIEQVAHLRATPHFTLIRPADALETAAAWKWAIQSAEGPVGLALSRQGLPTLHQYPSAGQVDKGGYILSEARSGKPEIILIATGSEVSLALEAQKVLEKENRNVRVVSLPAWNIFEAQSQSYRDSVLPPTLRKRLAIEALASFGWERYVGLDGDIIGMTTFGASAPGPTLLEKFGFTVDNVVKRAKAL